MACLSVIIAISGCSQLNPRPEGSARAGWASDPRINSASVLTCSVVRSTCQNLPVYASFDNTGNACAISFPDFIFIEDISLASKSTSISWHIKPKDSSETFYFDTDTNMKLTGIYFKDSSHNNIIRTDKAIDPDNQTYVFDQITQTDPIALYAYSAIVSGSKNGGAKVPCAHVDPVIGSGLHLTTSSH